jgi:CBS domain-containing protein
MTTQLSTGTATVASVMTHPFVVSPHAPFKHLVELLADRAVEAVAVVSATGGLVGEVSDVDLLRNRRGGRNRDRMTAGEVMSSRVPVVAPGMSLARAERMLIDRVQVYVVEDGRLVGVLSRRAALNGLCRRDKEIQADLERRIGDAVRVSVRDGVVLLTGRVPCRADVDAACAVVAGAPGVICVRNRVVAEVRN